MGKIGYKGFDKNLKCREFQYEIRKEYEYDGKIELCSSGFHFCKNIADVNRYYDISSGEARLCEIETTGEIIEGEDKCVTNKIKIIREISKEEMYILGNSGKGNTGLGNTGDSNTGYRNTGDSNTGYRNTGDWNTTDRATGCFCTEKQPMKFFDKKCNMTWEQWRNSEAYYILTRIPKSVWIWWEGMTEEEKQKNPKAKTTGGFMRELDLKEEAEKWWNKLDDNEKEIIRGIPNYNKTKFRKIMKGAKIG